MRSCWGVIGCGWRSSGECPSGASGASRGLRSAVDANATSPWGTVDPGIGTAAPGVSRFAVGPGTCTVAGGRRLRTPSEPVSSNATAANRVLGVTAVTSRVGSGFGDRPGDGLLGTLPGRGLAVAARHAGWASAGAVAHQVQRGIVVGLRGDGVRARGELRRRE